jgi:hypothetical protein
MPALDNDGPQSRQFMRAKTSRACEFDRVEPILSGGVAAFDVDVWGFAVFQAVEEEPERAGSQDGRHRRVKVL